MDDRKRRQHAERLVRLLQQGKHGMAAAHMRAALQRQGLLPAGSGAGEGSAEGSGVA